jgi:SAM-dependent methyltransferase
MLDGPEEYADGTYRWWHLSTRSPELLAVLDNGLLAPPGRVLDLGCGLGVEVAALTTRGFDAVGVDLSAAAIGKAGELHPGLDFRVADVRALPFPPASFDVLVDRGCLHYLAPPTGGNTRGRPGGSCAPVGGSSSAPASRLRADATTCRTTWSPPTSGVGWSCPTNVG